jgi:hypothetical protein
VKHITEFQKKDSLNYVSIRELVGCMKLMKMSTDEDVVVEGEYGENYYFILSGDVNIYVPIDKTSREYIKEREKLKELE